MTVLYTDRTTPLAVDAGNALGNALVLSYDHTGMGSLSEGAAYEAPSGSTPTLVKTGTINSVTRNGIVGRQPLNSADYRYQNATAFGLDVGTGDYTIGVCFSTGSTLPSTNRMITVFRVDGNNTTTVALISIIEFASNGWYVSAATTPSLGTGSTPVYYGTNKTVVFWLRRASGTLSAWTQEVDPASSLTRRNADSSSTTNWSSSTAQRVWGALNGSGGTVDVAIHSHRFWNAALSDTDMRDVGRDWWAIDENSTVTDTVTITSVSASSTIPSTSVISGTYSYAAGAPAGIEIQHGAASYVPLTNFVASGGNWSGHAVLADASSASLRARDVDTTAIVSADIASVTISTDAVGWTAYDTSTYGALQAVDFRLFQRDGSDQATSVRLVGTYVGSPTSLEWRYNGGSWATLDASPASNVFDETVTLDGPAQGALEVRFGNDTAVVGALQLVGVGDVYIAAGQSNHLGAATTYTPAVAPGGNPYWDAVELSLAHVWRRNVESAALKFGKNSDAVYSAFSGLDAGAGSYFGALSTLAMADGVPIAVVPAAKGSTTIGNWDSSSTATSTPYGALLATAQKVGSYRMVLWWQGEAEMAGTGTPSGWAAAMTTILDDWEADGQTTQWLLVIPSVTANGGDSDATTTAAQIASMASDDRVYAVVDMDDPTQAYAGIHYDSGAETSAVASRIWDALAAGSSLPTLTALTASNITTSGWRATLTAA